MTSKNITAALVATIVGLGLGGALSTAAPSGADPAADPTAAADPADAAFLDAVRGKGMRIKSDSWATNIAHSTCDVLGRTESVESAMRHVQNATSWKDPKDISNFASFAVQAYCPTSMPKKS